VFFFPVWNLQFAVKSATSSKLFLHDKIKTEAARWSCSPRFHIIPCHPHPIPGAGILECRTRCWLRWRCSSLCFFIFRLTRRQTVDKWPVQVFVTSRKYLFVVFFHFYLRRGKQKTIKLRLERYTGWCPTYAKGFQLNFEPASDGCIVC